MCMPEGRLLVHTLASDCGVWLNSWLISPCLRRALLHHSKARITSHRRKADSTDPLVRNRIPVRSFVLPCDSMSDSRSSSYADSQLEFLGAWQH